MRFCFSLRICRRTTSYMWSTASVKVACACFDFDKTTVPSCILTVTSMRYGANGRFSSPIKAAAGAASSSSASTPASAFLPVFFGDILCEWLSMFKRTSTLSIHSCVLSNAACNFLSMYLKLAPFTSCSCEWSPWMKKVILYGTRFSGNSSGSGSSSGGASSGTSNTCRGSSSRAREPMLPFGGVVGALPAPAGSAKSMAPRKSTAARMPPKSKACERAIVQRADAVEYFFAGAEARPSDAKCDGA
mmetsp:Transcript_112238/g.317227  ORF Transcript_112238/g.317227 Transcript_112238/m.317227 type:complete len:246 (-) Transcript_112238:9-746(-)